MFAYSPSEDGANDGYAVVTERFVCLLGADATSEAARAVFQALDGDDGQLEDALSALQAAAVERFAVIELLDADERSMHIAVRGELSVGIEGTTATRLSGSGESTWVTGNASGVSSLWLSLDEGASVDEVLPMARGVARTRAIVADPAPGRASADASEAVPASEKQRKPTKPAVQPDEVSSRSTLRVDLNEWMNENGTPRWTLRLPDGNELDAESTIVLGRKPSKGNDVDPLVQRVAVPSPKRQISGSHLELALVDGALVARDLDSTNGTIVLTPARAPRLLHDGRTTALQTGDILDLGESFRIVVSNGL